MFHKPGDIRYLAGEYSILAVLDLLIYPMRSSAIHGHLNWTPVLYSTRRALNLLVLAYSLQMLRYFSPCSLA